MAHLRHASNRVRPNGPEILQQLQKYIQNSCRLIDFCLPHVFSSRILHEIYHKFCFIFNLVYKIKKINSIYICTGNAFIKVYYMHEILQLILNKNVHGDNPPPPKKIHVLMKLLYQMISIVLCMLNKPSGFPTV